MLFSYNVRKIRTDNGLEFFSKDVGDRLRLQGIQHDTTVPYTPQQNGRAGRDMRTVIEAARSMMHAKGMSLAFWGEALNTKATMFTLLLYLIARIRIRLI